MERQQLRGRSLSDTRRNLIQDPDQSLFLGDATVPPSNLDPLLMNGFINNLPDHPQHNHSGFSRHAPPPQPLPHGTVSDTAILKAQQAHQPQREQSLGALRSSYFPPQPGSGQASSGFNNSGDTQSRVDSFPLLQDSGTGIDHSLDAFLLDPIYQGQGQPPPNESINPAQLMNDIPASSPTHTSPPSLSRQQSSPGPQPSPAMNQNAFLMQHARHTSLDPSSAAYPQAQLPQDWSTMVQQASFQRHRRAPSEHSDVSSSVAPSPYLAHADSFGEVDAQGSPLLVGQPDQSSLFQDALGIDQFTLSDNNNNQPRLSPGHSPHASPHLSPQQGLSPISGVNAMFSSGIASNGHGNGVGGLSTAELYPGQPQAPMGMMQVNGSDPNNVGQMAPPEINIEFAVPSQTSEPSRPLDDGNALSPPERSRRARMRAKSDPYTGGSPMSRPMTPNATSPRLGPQDSSSSHRSLSPHDIVTAPVVSGASSASQKSSRRSSTSSIPNRDYILDLADPQRPGSNASDTRRVQKHPATFQCHLCVKRFTRAYNLRSHLRTHTDERPFVCNYCGKAFARQHDRKRHEGLHSGEKKFVCKGELKSGHSWGCGRRFARADALGRHFRSEAGRVCIKPLLDEERIDHQRAWSEAQMMSSGAAAGTAMDPMSGGYGNGPAHYGLPQALLAQYPALATLSWDQLGATTGGGNGVGGGNDDEDVLSGRSDFDASSGGEWIDEEGVEGTGYVSSGGMGWSGGSGSGGGGGEVWR
ncbi:MAG: DNA-binding transcription factor [Caeruleum heppii]|nr:MAG: DNA-binding transcription factor [Caeruleum heppii]